MDESPQFHCFDYQTIRYCRRIIETDANDYQANTQIARLYQRIGHTSAAIDTNLKLTRIAPGAPKPYRNLGEIYLATPETHGKAAQMFMEFLKRNPNQPDLMHFLAQTKSGQDI